jgi:signal transduction histidine kinase
MTEPSTGSSETFSPEIQKIIDSHKNTALNTKPEERPEETSGTIASRISALATLLILAQIVITIYAIAIQARTNDSVQPISEVDVPLLASVAVITTAQFEQHALLQQILRIGQTQAEEFPFKEQNINNAIQRFKLLTASIQSEFVELRTIFDNPDKLTGREDIRDRLQLTHAQYNEFSANAETVLAILASTDPDIANSMIELMEFDSKILGESLLEISDVISERAAAKVENVKYESATFYALTATIGLIALLFAISLSYAIIRRTGKSASHVTSGIVRASESLNDLAVPNERLPTATGDEFGRIGSAVNRLLDELENTMNRRDQAERRLTGAVAQANAANVAKSRFLANMSHELRTPLNAILGYSQLLQEDLNDLETLEIVNDLGRIETAGEHLLSLISGILDLSKIEAGTSQVNVSSISIKEVLDFVETTIAPQMQARGNQFKIEAPATDIELITDSLKLKQVLINLLSNAAKFTKDGQIWLRIERLEINGESRLRFSVSDTGVGIPEEDLDRIFEPFQQSDNSYTREYDGTGLGLAICHHFVQELGGEILVDSQLGEGSIFYFDTPVNLRAHLENSGSFKAIVEETNPNEAVM